MAEAMDANPDPVDVTPVGQGWAHGFLTALDLYEAKAARERGAVRVRIQEGPDPHPWLHGPCDGCGFSYRAESTDPRPPCPNCGHRASPQD